MDNSSVPFRLDFKIRVLSTDETTRTIRFELIPDPDRYEWRELDGKEFLYDRFDKTLTSKEAFKKLASQMVGKPLYYQPHRLGNLDEYIGSRRDAIKSSLQNEIHTPEATNIPSDFLETLNSTDLSFVILVIDVVGSTLLSTGLDRESYIRIISTVLVESSRMVSRFNGHVLKYTGDGLIAYFPAPSFNTQHDLAIDCASCLTFLMNNAVNPAIEEKSWPRVKIRIGIESGEASVVTVGSPDAKQHKDIMGSVINLAAKIQAKAAPGEILLGEMAERSMHTMWRKCCKLSDPGIDWPYKNNDGTPYRIFRLVLETAK